MKHIDMRIESDLKQQIAVEAKKHGVSPSVIVRPVLERHFQPQEPAEDCRQLAERLGIIGSISGTSPRPEHQSRAHGGIRSRVNWDCLIPSP